MAYRLLIDCYRLWDEGERIGRGTIQDPRVSIYEGVSYVDGYSFKGLKRFIKTVEKTDRVRPEWWTVGKSAECRKLARQLYHWSDIQTDVGVEVNDFCRYGGPSVRLPLRMLAMDIMRKP